MECATHSGHVDAVAEDAAADAAEEFLRHRPRLLGIAYRMLGSWWDAEDVVADAMVRWLGLDRAAVRQPVAFLTTMVTRLAIDQLRSARVARERYVGTWLPEPVLTSPSSLGPLDTAERRETVSLAVLRMMEELTPPERAVLVLHEVFEVPHAEIADTLGISVDGARQHLHRARARLKDVPSRSGAEPGEHDAVLERFLSALERGDLDTVQELLATDVVTFADGGGKARAARYPLVGGGKVARFFVALRRYFGVHVDGFVEVNGRCSALLRFGPQEQLLSVEVGDGRIHEIDSVINPDKLRTLRNQLDAHPPARREPAPATR